MLECRAFWILVQGVDQQLIPPKAAITGVHGSPSVFSAVGVTKTFGRDSGTLRGFSQLDELPGRDADLADLFKLVIRALILVSKGASERNAVQQVVSSDPHMNRAKRGAFALVLRIVNEQDLLDLYLRSALSEDKLGINARCLFRLTAYAILRLHSKLTVRQIERALRAVVPSDLLPKFEVFLGVLPAYDESLFFSDLRDSEKVALQTHQQVWWVEYCFKMLGRADAVSLLSSRLRPRYLRINPLKNQGTSTLPKALGTLADRLTKIPSIPGVYTLRGSISAFAEFFKDGLFQVQDLASYLAIMAAAPKPREKVLELCAAPGAKTAALAQLMKNRGRIVSVDYSLRRMIAWKRETQRLGVEIADPVIGDAARLGLNESFDMVVVDPPCTGTGIFDRNPRMKWHVSAQSVDRYSILQQRFLDSAASLVKKDGRILYCTCSLTVEENEEVVASFLKSHPEFETRPALENLGGPALRGMVDCRRFYPHRDRTAGYFIGRIERAS